MVRFKIAPNIEDAQFGRRRSVHAFVLGSCVCVLALAGFYHIFFRVLFFFCRKAEEIQACQFFLATVIENGTSWRLMTELQLMLSSCRMI